MSSPRFVQPLVEQEFKNGKWVKKDFDEGQHPRDYHGKFTPSGGSGRSGDPYSYRDFKPGSFASAYKDAVARKDVDAQYQIRRKFQSMESGRLHSLGEKAHILFSSLDPDERALFKQRMPGLVDIMNEYATVEDLGTF